MTINDIEMCIEEAITFLKVAEKLEEDEDSILGGIYPFVVNSAFACELFLKAIIMVNTMPPAIIKEHKLKNLFNKLPADDQKQIKELFNMRMKNDLHDLLDELSNTFIEWRYAFEHSVKINATGILTFSQVLKDYIAEQYLEAEE